MRAKLRAPLFAYLATRSLLLAVPIGASLPETAPETAVSAQMDLDSARAYPNPWRVDQHASRPVIFDQMPTMTSVRIFTVSGAFVKTLDAADGSATWDLTNDAGQGVASGVYLYVLATDDGQEFRGKLAVIK